MYGLSSLKPRLEADTERIACPVRGCRVQVPMQRAVVRATAEYQCPVHRLFLSASSFRYERETDNLLWTDREALAALNAGRPMAAERSFGSELSEEAVTWNVFGWLERAGLLPEALERWAVRPVASADPWYWGFSRQDAGVPFALRRARSAFGEDQLADDRPSFLTTPAVVAETDDALIAVDSRVVSLRRVPLHARDLEPYARGGDGWAERTLAGAWPEAFKEKVTNELIRLWLVGSYAAHLLEKEFVLLHIVPSWAGEGAATALVPLFRQGSGRRFVVGHWEDAYDLAQERPGAPHVDAFSTYMEEKSAGYDSSGRLLRCFAVEASSVAGARATQLS